MPHITTHVLDGLVASDQFPPEDCQKMQAIKAKNETPCSLWDALAVAAMVFRCLRRDEHHE